MIKTIPISEARQKFPTLVDKISRLKEKSVITVNGRPAVVIMSVDEYESWEETNEILADKQLMEDIRQSEKELSEGKGELWEDVKKELGWD